MAHRDPDAENLLVSTFHRALQLKLRRRLRSPELVQDASQETFLRVLSYFRSGKTLENPASLPGFMHSVCHNISLEFIRQATRYSQIPENAPETADAAASAEVLMLSQETQTAVRQALDGLPQKDRELLRRVFLEEEDKDRVCQEFQVDRTYLRVLLHRARLRFKAVLVQSDSRQAAGGPG
ncbi:MAG: sigma-70 family RNA polymerase sigma factor [Acidobacteriia bacterium]|nr:sigma-70 family RNA polymerase sigma factor [Terriglobia bacterium]